MRILLTAPSWSCFVTVFVFVGISIDSLLCEEFKKKKKKKREKRLKSACKTIGRPPEGELDSLTPLNSLCVDTTDVQAKTAFLSRLAPKRPFFLHPTSKPTSDRRPSQVLLNL